MDWKKHLEKIVRYDLSESSCQTSVGEWANIGLRIEALEGKKTVYEFSYDGAVEADQYELFKKAVEKLSEEFHLIESKESPIPQWKLNTATGRDVSQLQNEREFNRVFINDDSIVNLVFSKKDSSVNVKSLDRDKALAVVDMFKPLMKKKKDRQGRACTLLKDQSIYVSDLGPAGIPLLRQNYLPDIIEDYDFLIKDLSSPTPYGRLVILDGPPGSGKTYFVRGLVNDVEGCIFLIVPSTLIAHISDPSFMPAIIELHQEEKAPIILILEDADFALLPRGADNMSMISDLLNFADGIVGNIIDFRIIATTNARRMDMEPALLRKGRLSRRINISKLPKKFAVSVYEKISGKSFEELPIEKKDLFRDKITLAEVYDVAYVNSTKENEKESEEELHEDRLKGQ